MPTIQDVPERAFTDVFDEERSTFLIQYPARLIVGLSLFGVVAFALVGFFGFRDSTAQPDLLTHLFHEPWPLFLFFCGLIMALQASVLRARQLRPQLVASLTTTVICMIIVGAAYYYGNQISSFLEQVLQQVLNIRQFVPELGKSKYFYALINFGILAIFWVDTIRRWIRGAQGKDPRPGVDIGLSSSRNPIPDEDKPTFDELVSGDLIAAAVLTLVLAVIFRTDTINLLTGVLQVGVKINTCVVSWPFGHCVSGAGLGDPPTLSFLDLIQALIYLPIGLLILALSATLSGLQAGEGLDPRQARTSRPVSQEDRARDGSTGTVTEEVTLTLLNTLRSAINRRARHATTDVGISLRNVFWPFLVLISVIAVASSARGVQTYLHLMSDMRTCTSQACPDFGAVQSALTFGQPYVSVLGALFAGIVAVLAITFSLALLVFSTHVVRNTIKFLGLVGFIVLVTFWIFSLSLSGFNQLLWLMHAANRWPFPQPGAGTIISFICLLVFAARFLMRRAREARAARASSPASAKVGAARASQ